MRKMTALGALWSLLLRLDEPLILFTQPISINESHHIVQDDVGNKILPDQFVNTSAPPGEEEMNEILTCHQFVYNRQSLTNKDAIIMVLVKWHDHHTIPLNIIPSEQLNAVQ